MQSLSTLEYEKLLALVASNAQTPMGKLSFENLLPLTSFVELERDLAARTSYDSCLRRGPARLRVRGVGHAARMTDTAIPGRPCFHSAPRQAWHDREDRRRRRPCPGPVEVRLGQRQAAFRRGAQDRIRQRMLLPRSRLAASHSRSSSSKPFAGRIAVTAGRPSVRVPVLSMTNVSIFSISSSASAFLIRTPIDAPRPTPTMIDIGVTRPSAQGQAMIRTATAETTPLAKRGSGPQMTHPMKANTATVMTAGTNHPATWSANRWIGARERCACATIWTIRARTVSPPTLVAVITSAPLWLMVPPMTCRPGLW